MSETPFKYDVAITFLSRDLAVAQAIADKLTPDLDVFVYARKQEDVAGTNGIETFRQVFSTESRLVVVLFRDGWGETPWTQIEKIAIEDRFLDQGPGFLFFVMLSSKSTPPKWVPETRIRFDIESYGVDQAAGAIRLRVEQLGGETRKESMAERAERTARATEFANETERMWRQDSGVNAATQSAKDFIDALLAFAQDASAAAPSLGIQCAAKNLRVGIRAQGGSALAGFRCSYTNSLDDAVLYVQFFRDQIILPGENKHYVFEEPKATTEYEYSPARTMALGWCWERGKGQVFSSRELAEQVMSELLDRIASKR
jgi:hypothetical protein